MPQRCRTKVGAVYGRLRVICDLGQTKVKGRTIRYFACSCECGTELRVKSGALVSGNTRSCGCLHREQLSKRMRKHGMARSSEYDSWCHMISRCEKKTNRDYRHYGGRGIRVCTRWRKSFKDFFGDMGVKPGKGYSLDRIDFNGHYKPSNCRWVTQKQQTRNCRDNRWITIDGVKKCLIEWAEESGIPGSAIRHRLTAGWHPKDAVFTPSRKKEK